MKKYLLFVSLFFFVLEAKSTVDIDVKIEQKIGGKVVETNKKISTNYNEDIIITGLGMDNKIVLKLQKISKINVNGNSVSPVQVDLKLIDGTQTQVGKPHTVTSFYKQSAEFALPSNGMIDHAADLNILLNFKEIN